MNDLKLNDLIKALKILYKYVKFRQKINEIFPNFNIQNLRFINFYNFDDILRFIFSNVKASNKDINEVLNELEKEFGELRFEDLRNCVNIIRQFYSIDRYIISCISQLVSMSSININQLLNLVKLEKEESKVEKEVEEEVKEEDVKIDKDKLDLILNNKV